MRKKQPVCFLFLKYCSVLLACVLCAITPASGQEHEIRFSHLDINEGLSNNQVNAIWKDQQGFMWFGTLSGLNRYDGYDFKVYKFDHQDSTSIADSYIEKIFEDHQGNLWVRTRRGLNVYDHMHDAFQRDITAYLADFDIVANNIVGIVKDQEKNFWYVSSTQGMYQYYSGTNTTRHFPTDSLDKAKLHPAPITAVEVDPKGDLWVVHDNGILEKIDPKSGKVLFRSTQLADQNNNSLMNYQMLIDSDGDMWFYVFEQAIGLFYYQQETERLQHFHKNSSEGTLNTNIVHSVVQADDGLIWIGTDHGGINLLDKKNRSVRYLLQNTDQKNSLSLNSINTMYKEDNGTIWVGTFKRGIDLHHDKLFKFKLYKNDPSDAESLPYEDINAFVEDSLGNLWIGTNGGACSIMTVSRSATPAMCMILMTRKVSVTMSSSI